LGKLKKCLFLEDFFIVIHIVDKIPKICKNSGISINFNYMNKKAKNLLITGFVLFLGVFSFPYTVSAVTEVSGVILENTTWIVENSPYVVNGGISVSPDATLTIEPGVVIKFKLYLGYPSGMVINGNLDVQGTEANKVYFTSYADDIGGDTNGDGDASVPGPNNWKGIKVEINGQADIDNAVIRYGGYHVPNCSYSFCYDALNNLGTLNLTNSEISYNGTGWYAIKQLSGPLNIDSTVITDNGGTGVSIKGGAVQINNSIISNNGGYGVGAGGNAELTLSNNIFENNSKDVYLTGNALFSHSNNTSLGGNYRGFYMYSYNPPNGSVWNEDDMPYIVDTVAILSGSALTIEPGAVIKMGDASSFLWVLGVLNVQGTDENKVYFTSIKDNTVGGDTNGDEGNSVGSAGQWERIIINAGGLANIDNAIIRYGGFKPSGCVSQLCFGVINNAGTLNLTNSEIIDNDWYGIYQTAGTAMIDSTIIARQSRGIYLPSGNSSLVIHNSLIFNNTGYGILNYSSNTVDATRNWWGDPTGPYHYVLNTGGLGNAVSDGVNFSPWFNYDPTTQQPPIITNLQQFRLDEKVEMVEGESTANNLIIFESLLTDQNEENVKMQVELKEYNQFFDEQNLLESDYVSSGNLASITVNDLPKGDYKWRARAVNETGFTSEWKEFGEISNIDFSVVSIGQAAADLATTVIDGDYLGDAQNYGGKGWDIVSKQYVNTSSVIAGYNYYHAKTVIVDGELRKGNSIYFDDGLDCSGLVQWSYNRSYDPFNFRIKNYILEDSAQNQYWRNSHAVNENELDDGDLMFFGYDDTAGRHVTHVAMYVGDRGNYNVVHAANKASGIIVANKEDLKTLNFFNDDTGFRRAINRIAAVRGYAYVASPVDLVVTDPEGNKITTSTVVYFDNEMSVEVPDELYYTAGELGDDGRPKDMVYWTKDKVGNFLIKVVSEANTSPTDTYSLFFNVGNNTITLAEDVPISEIPKKGYGVSVSDTGTIEEFTPVNIDIKPDSSENTINLGSNGSVPVAIFGSDTVDVKNIDLNTVNLASASIKLKGNGDAIVKYEDLNSDGYDDVVIHILTEVLQLTENDVKATLEGVLMDGTLIKGSGLIRVVP